MAGFPLMAIGAGIGQGAEAIQKQRAQQIEMAIARLKMQQYQQEQDSAKALFPAALSGALDAGQMSPLGTGSLGLPPAAPPFGGGGGGMPQMGGGGQQQYSPAPSGSGMSSGLSKFRQPVGSPENERITDLIIQDESGGRNIKQRVVGPSGGYNPSVGRVTGPSSAQGLGQFIDSTWRSVAPKVGAGQYAHAMDAPPELQRKAISQQVADRGVSDWAPYNSTLAKHLGITGPSRNPAQGEADQTTLRAASSIPPEVYGRMSMQALAQQIEKANPGADPMVKMLALERGAKLMAPAEARMWEFFKLQHQETLLAERQKAIDARAEKAESGRNERFNASQERIAAGSGQIIETDQGPMRIPPGGTKAVPIDIGGAKVLGKGGKPQQANIVAYDKDGKRLFGGAANYDPQTKQWSNSATNEPIVADHVEVVGKGGGAASGGRAGAQTSRQLTGAREVQSDLEAVTSLPITVTRGIFGGRTQGPGLFDALKENLAETLTDEDAQLTNSALAGLGRELSNVVSPVYGGRWASDQFNALTLKEGQSVLVKLYNIARMRQIVDNGLETIINTDWVGPQQKDYAAKMRDSINKTVPWTIQDVLAFKTKGDDQQSFSDFVKSNQIGGAAGRKEGEPAATAPLPAADAAGADATSGQPLVPESKDVEILKGDPNPTYRQYFDKRYGPGSAAKALGEQQ